MKKPIHQRGSDDRATDDFAPFGKATVGGEDHRALFVAGVDELELPLPGTTGRLPISSTMSKAGGQ